MKTERADSFERSYIAETLRIKRIFYDATVLYTIPFHIQIAGT